MTDAMDTDKVLQTLDEALRQQSRTLLMMTLLAGSLTGLGGAAVKPSLRSFVAAELEDTYLLVEKMSALGGIPRFDVGEAVELPDRSTTAVEQLIEHEREAVAALHAVIPHSGQEPRSEALEHLLEHVIMRKHQQIDFLWHATQES